jgi:hypothetical protein
MWTNWPPEVTASLTSQIMPPTYRHLSPLSAVPASSSPASDVGALALRVDARRFLVVGRDGQGSSVSALVIRSAYPCMSQVPYFGSR